MPSYVIHPRELPTHFRSSEINLIASSQASKTTILHFDLWFFLWEINTCHMPTYFIPCILSFENVSCVCTWWRGVFYLICLSVNWGLISLNSSLFFSRRRIYRLDNLLFRPVTSLLFLPSVLRSSTIRFVTEQVDWSFTVFFSHLQVESRSLYIVTRTDEL